ncbi:Eco57I restriction-modification methylase domain-containing protein [Pseudonocardia abyssalis]|uniref:site-specific DNA-methyltransferase (adenine-specific) n=1 Tax=Pseudonocardia abyssalis TaxID=2792008 RepID=A0ABS6UXM4_9PSEU|nr:hypothetical protein [Pseudonocardia abyssalis]MBW0113911.1 SAM-dependent methyltransferase [Pseudonocardia abyssalis]MBW0137005.1 SAM-dependent methyltransferase [Pseudonocardia abyssalis]
MKLAAEVSPEKLRGGFYSPPALVKVCFDRIQELVGGREHLSLLEPSSGDGEFIRGLAAHASSSSISRVVAVEIAPSEAAKTATAIRNLDVAGETITGSVLEVACRVSEQFDVAVGNPPYVRFQFVSESDRLAAQEVSEKAGVSLAGVSNLWIPVLLASLNMVRNGGAFAFIIPTECFTGISARMIRTWLSCNSQELRVDLFPPKSFSGVLQEVVVLSGRVHRETQGEPKLTVCDHAVQNTWVHLVETSATTWTGYLLTPEQLSAFDSMRSIPSIYSLGDVARIGVATVTGANQYFTVTDATLDEYRLHPWRLPLLPRIRHAQGLVFRDEDFAQMSEGEAPRWLLDFSASNPDVVAFPKPAEYIARGQADGLPGRYKCRIRDPWYRVPVVPIGQLLMSKRSHIYPRLIVNDAGVGTTDTIYKGVMRPEFSGRERDLVALFHNSYTLLTAEIEGRSFGGGVLELVPSEVGRLKVPLANAAEYLPVLDALTRKFGGDSELVVEETNRILVEKLKLLPKDVLQVLQSARHLLLRRRMGRAGVGE